MDPPSPTKRIAALSAAKKAKKQRYAEGKLVAEDMEHWVGPLERAGLLSCTDFSKKDGAAEAAGDDAFAAPDTADAARDKAYQLLEDIDCAPQRCATGPKRLCTRSAKTHPSSANRYSTESQAFCRPQVPRRPTATRL